MSEFTIFKAGDKVKIAKFHQEYHRQPPTGMEFDKIYVVGAVVNISEPEKFYPDWPFFEAGKPGTQHGRTKLQIHGHPQFVFFDEFLLESNQITPITDGDPEPEKRRVSFTGAWFELANQS